jgi:hypothetical protein
MPSFLNINKISPELRDYLLGLNLKPSPTITSNNYEQYLSGVGLPFTVKYGSGVSKPLKNIFDFAKMVWRPDGLGLNKYKGNYTTDIVDTGIVISELYVNNSPNNQSKPYSINNIQFLGSNITSPDIYTSNNQPLGPLSYSANTNQGWDFYLKNVGYSSGFQYDKEFSSGPYTDKKTGPGFPALTEVTDSKGNVFGPNTNLNKYKGDVNDKQYVGQFINQTIGVINQKDSYLNEYGKLNVKNGQFDEAFNIVSSLVKGGVGINKDGNGIGVVSNNDVRNTLVGRVLTASGAIGDTDLGIIGAERLAISLTNNAVFKFQRQTIGKVNLQLFNYIDNNSTNNRVIKENYEITIPDNWFGKGLDFLGDLVGFTSPKSQLGVEFFSFDNKLKPTLIGNIARANAMLDSTGKGQVKALFDNIRASLNNSNTTRQGYAPGYENRGEILFSGQDAPRFNVYAYGDLNGEIIEHQNLGNHRWTDTDGSGFEGDYFRYKTDGNSGNFGSATESDFIWADDKINIDKNGGESLIKDADEIFGESPSESETNSLYNPNRKSILYKTKELFKKTLIQTMVNAHVTNTEMSQIQSSVLANGMMSKGNAALTKLALSGEDNAFSDSSKIYCRTWTPMDKYDEVADLVRHRALYKHGGDYNRNSKLSEYSVLENTGFVKIANYLKDNNESSKRYMFSIENLAWIGQDNTMKVNGVSEPNTSCENGPFGGRIMWFPPYDIKFSESTSVNWDKHNFIGRGEPMYTYNNTERTGQLSFKVIIDHPNHINVKEGNNVTKSDDHYASFFAGCNELEVKPSSKKLQRSVPVPRIKPKETTDPKVRPPVFSIFFPNDDWTYPTTNPQYESGLISIDGVSNIRTIISTGSDGNKYIKPKNYNNYMGFTGNTSTNPKKGPLSPIGLPYNEYNDNKIDYKKNPDGKYFGLGMTKADNPVIGSRLLYIDRFNYGLNANRHDADKHNLTIPGNEAYAGCRWGGWLAASDMDKDNTNKNCQVSYLTALKDHMKGPCKYCVIKIIGFASVQGNSQEVGASETEKGKKNRQLSQQRADNIKKYFEENVIDPNDPNKSKRITSDVKGVGANDAYGKLFGGGAVCERESDQDILACKLDRRVKVTFDIDPELEKDVLVRDVNGNVVYDEISMKTDVPIPNGMKERYEECSYFQKVAEDDPFTFKQIIDKIKFFSPAFHSTSPEGFNSRLTFLQQCTRQGPSNYTESTKPDNLVFGRPPVCVLRIGDFYYTKIIIESMSFDYEPLVWDLNPEGVGVQPMIANVSINFSFIGGSSLDGPISKLQNALSFNYFANTGLFDTRANTNDSEYKKESNNENPNDLYEDNTQEGSNIKSIDNALSRKEIDRKILDEGDLVVYYDDSGPFQGKVKGTYIIKNTLSKEYPIKLTAVSSKVIKDKNLGDEMIDVGRIKLGDLEADFKSKSKTQNSLQEWAYYFTDTFEALDKADENYDATKESNLLFYYIVQANLDAWVQKNTVDEYDMTGFESDGWDIHNPSQAYANDGDSLINIMINEEFNFKFKVEVDELDFNKEFTVRWVPYFYPKRFGPHRAYEEDTFGVKHVEVTYVWKAYLSGGKLDVVKYSTSANEKGNFLSADETKYFAKIAANTEKAEKKKIKKGKKTKEKEEKDKAKADRDNQKAKVAEGKGSLS